MSKAFFRYLRGELNGYYLTSINNVMNSFVLSVRDFFVFFNSQQFNKRQMSEEVIENLGKFAGVFLPYFSVGEGYGHVQRMTESEIVNGEERSERGLMERTTEDFEFVHTEQDDYDEDINTLATFDLKSSLAGEDDPVVGYLSSAESDLLDEKGNVEEDKVLSTPPVGVAYSDYYGNQFLYMFDDIVSSEKLVQDVFYDMFLVMQHIRYNGASIETLCRLVSSICPDGLVKIASITKVSNVPYLIVEYIYNNEIVVPQKNQRLGTLLYVLSQKFPQVTMVEKQVTDTTATD